MDTQTILTLIGRHVLTTLGGWLVSHGYLQASGLEGFVGAGMVIAGVFWSVWDKRGRDFLVAEKKRMEGLLGRRSELQAAFAQQTAASKAPPAPSVPLKQP
jgi:hypothetical protein